MLLAIEHLFDFLQTARLLHSPCGRRRKEATLTLEEVGFEYLSQAENIRTQITGLRPLLEIYRDDKLNSLKNKIYILYRLGRLYSEIGKNILSLGAAVRGENATCSFLGTNG